MNRAKPDGLVQEIVGLSSCFQSVMEAGCVMKAVPRALTHNHSCILLSTALLMLGMAILSWDCTIQHVA